MKLPICYVNGERIHGSKGGNLDLLKLKADVSKAEVMAVIRKNGTDELLFRTNAGDLHLIQGDPLGQGPFNLRFPRPGQTVSVANVEGEVLHADNERSFRTSTEALSVLAGLLALGTAPMALLLGLFVGVGWAPASDMGWLLGAGATSAAVAGVGVRRANAHDRLKSSARHDLEPMVEQRTPLAR